MYVNSITLFLVNIQLHSYPLKNRKTPTPLSFLFDHEQNRIEKEHLSIETIEDEENLSTTSPSSPRGKVFLKNLKIFRIAPLIRMNASSLTP